ncbi:hypothetical protein GUITHDRAFT_105248 [Guillardia theta CCMP2712]|uniref:PDZ domain-containing protein n=1 Tax=Guillardia theta (strain CCMP2712) TaxID=905079 RepID=L1JLV1_GUITC|nr:hypothetical protein GUITHDRAFT_105248 [Guillardia theta CCMP2712]EKX49174.1 hypothetical protein GUITHDRAFT_105248 [Guillardia theta CCMP2712]|eukprot:XP_005836154.1 hypothetical protein GUITHDRAFT_105248 [Guillardia theta CCMP2712]
MSEGQVAGIGAILGYDSNRRVVVTKMLPRGTAATSGMVQVGDEIVKIDSQEVKEVAQASSLLKGESGSMVRLKLRRFVAAKKTSINLDCTLVREVGNEHVLQQEHHGFQGVNHNRNEMSGKDIYDRMVQGQMKINENMVHHKEEKASQADALYAKLTAKDEEKKQGGGHSHFWGHKQEPAKKSEEPKQSGFSMFGNKKKEEKAKSDDFLSNPVDYVFGKPKPPSMYQRTKENMIDHAIDYKKERIVQKDNSRRAGHHMWPWEVKNHDKDWLEQDVPGPFDSCFQSRKK